MRDLDRRLEEVSAEARRALEVVTTLRGLTEWRARFLGRRGAINALLQRLREMPPEARPAWGERVNALKESLEAARAERERALGATAEALRASPLDITLPGRPVATGGLHPITQTLSEIVEIFRGMGFSVAHGPEIEMEYYNFEALNVPADHPARDMQATIYLSGNRLLRTHTSPVQIRVMEKVPPPVRIVVPGRVFRSDSPDPSHLPVFHQVEGLAVDEGITMADLKATLEEAARQLFGPESRVRLRPSFFPFTEPSAEVDVQCVVCGGAGCGVCKGTGWVEILGSGMVDPAVFAAVGYDAERYTGFAFGMGVERIAMIRYGIADIRLFLENDVRFLAQFEGGAP